MLNCLPFPWELGRAAADLCRDPSEANKTNCFDTLFRCGPVLRKLPDTLSSGQRGGYAGMQPTSLVTFGSETEAQQAGYRKAKNCP